MRVSPGVRALASFGVPLILVAGLARYDLGAILTTLRLEVWFTAVALVLAVALGVASERVWKFQFRIEKGSSGFVLVALAGFLTYLLGSYLRSFSLHWVSFPVIYLGLCGYLGGLRAAKFLVPSVALITLVVLPTLLPEAMPLAGYGAAAGICVAGLVLVRFRVKRQEECENCRTYLRQGAQFCLRCGRQIGGVRLPLGGRRLAEVFVVSALVLLLFALSVPILTMGSSGLDLTNYSLTGGAGSTPVPTVPGWTASPQGSFENDSGYVASYAMNGGGSLNVTVSISASPYVSGDNALAGVANPAKNGTAEVSPGTTATVVVWGTNQSSEGLLWGTQVSYLSEGRIAYGFATVLVSGSSSSYSSDNGGFLTVSRSIEGALTPNGVFAGFVTPVLGVLLPYDGYLVAGLASCALVGVAAAARSMDRRDARRLDGSLELESTEFDALVSIARVGSRLTGTDLLAKSGLVKDWPSMERILNKFSRLGLVEPEVFAREGRPHLLWACRVA